jgi:cysteine synthase
MTIDPAPDRERPPVLAAIGHTPVVRLTRLVEPDMAEVWVKLESHNPTGSYKDRMALAMIEGAERSGRLRPLRVARRLGPGHRVATVLVDSGLKYLGGEIYR